MAEPIVMAAAEASPREARLLVVDDEPMIRDLLCSYLSDHGFACESSGSVDEALRCLARNTIDLVISDLHMPGRTGLELLEAMGKQHPHIGFLMATAAPDTQSAVRAMRNGAADFLVKPLDLKQVLARVRETLARLRQNAEAERHRIEMERLLAERTQQLGFALRQVQQASAETLHALSIALDVRARDVAGHSLRVSRYGVELATKLGYNREELSRIEFASYLHDIGKLGVPDAILNKPAALSDTEIEVMRSHVQIGFDLVSQVPSLAAAGELVLAHQEHYDGTGYPRGLAGDAIPRDARIFAVADALDAMTSDRPYRKSMGWSEARNEIVRQSGRQFDPKVVEAFLSIPMERWLEIQNQREVSPHAAA
ncbi:MAG TPA: HD domain-containing phosphohydrolase [Terriglobales bacterium]|nr:HD domain-containing phosphohydrolase [Terriglobales bacterium]